MKVSYNRLKEYVSALPEVKKLEEIFTYHLCEVEGIEKIGEDTVFDLNILPNRAHDLLSHFGIAKELASLLSLSFVDPRASIKLPKPKETKLEIKIETDKCRRYLGRIIKGVKVGPSPEWMKKYLEALGQRSINNIVDTANIIMYDLGQPTHAFDLDKLASEKIIVRKAKKEEKMTTLDGKDVLFTAEDMLITDKKNILAIAGVKGGKIAEVDNSTKNIVLEVASFDPASVRKTAQRLNIFTDARKRFENDLSPELGDSAMREFSALILEVSPGATLEEVVDVYPEKQKERTLVFSPERISKILGVLVSQTEIEEILKKYNFSFKKDFEIIIPPLRLDLETEEDLAEEIGRVLGYEKVVPKKPEINFVPRLSKIQSKINWAREKLLNEGYSEVMTYVFAERGEREVLKSASDKKFLRANLSDGLKESLKLNQLNAPLLGVTLARVFEIGTVFLKEREEIRVAFGEQKKITEISLEEFAKNQEENIEEKEEIFSGNKFKMWSLYPFIARDIAVWLPEKENPEELQKILKENAGELLMKDPELFDSFTKEGQTSYAFRLIFQSFDRTLTDAEIGEIMLKIEAKIKEKKDWQIR